MAGGFKNRKQMTKRELQEQVGDRAENAIKMIQGLAVVTNQQIRNLKLETSNLASMSIMRDDPNGVVTNKSLLYIDFVGTLKNEDGTLGDNFEGGEGIGVFVDMEVHQFLSDFQQNLLGMRVGEVKVFDVKFPEDYGAKEIAGKTAQFEVQVRKVFSEIPSSVATKALEIQKAREAKKAQQA
jgi:FKBP-type peptidyl-prolyl cis-trans isomerase (trigger factor)